MRKKKTKDSNRYSLKISAECHEMLRKIQSTYDAQPTVTNLIESIIRERFVAMNGKA